MLWVCVYVCASVLREYASAFMSVSMWESFFVCLYIHECVYESVRMCVCEYVIVYAYGSKHVILDMCMYM